VLALVLYVVPLVEVLHLVSHLQLRIFVFVVFVALVRNISFELTAVILDPDVPKSLLWRLFSALERTLSVAVVRPRSPLGKRVIGLLQLERFVEVLG